MRPGLYDDTTAIRRVTGEPYMLAGGTAALLLQLAHPKVAQGVAEHSDFKSDVLPRLLSTLDYLTMVVFGTKDEAHRIAWHAMRAHDRVHGDGYSAHDHDLLTWVFATLSMGGLDLNERVFGPLDPDTAARYFHESVHLATLLGAPREALPADYPAFRHYWHQMIDSLEVSDVARGEARAILYPSQPYLRPLAPLNRVLTAGLLPPPIRRQYGLRWTPGRARLFAFVMGSGAVAMRITPRSVRQLPLRVSVRVARRTRWPKYQLPDGRGGRTGTPRVS